MADKFQPSMPVLGYTEQPVGNVSTINAHKRMEERVLREIDALLEMEEVDQRWASIARTHIEQGFMALNRAVFQPQRISLPEDDDHG